MCKGNSAEKDEVSYMIKKEMVDKKNYPKYYSYRLAFKMIDDALKFGCPLQAITIEESILTDRLSSTLNVGILKGKPYETLGSVLNAWRPKKKGKELHSNAILFDVPPANFQCNKYIWNSADKYFLV